ncbi:MAG: DMT family transporter [Hyphomicrobiales bacterium]|nr:DMT family transporter [Hyphomicrobiales bacterium]
MIKWPFILAAIGIGGLIAIQPGINSDVARRLDNPFAAAFLSISVSFLLATVYVLSARQNVSWSAVTSLPWYLWLGGTIGAIFVAGSLWLAPVLGAAALFAAMIAGQMMMALIVDWFGFGGYQSQGFDPWRLLAVGLVLAGVLIFQRSA